MVLPRFGSALHNGRIGVNVGVYDNPHDLTPNTWTPMRLTKYENRESAGRHWPASDRFAGWRRQYRPHWY
jgi:hypothetical protein